MLATMMLEVGQQAPTFSLPDADMETVDLARLIGTKNIVLYFYPKDGGPGCTQEAIEFSDFEGDFAKRNTVIFGISTDDCLRHAEFRDEHGIAVNLLADVEGEACQLYGVLNERESHGEIRRSAQRATFVIGCDGLVRHAMYGVSPRGHAREVLDLIDELNES
jgi:thioredoxin-dependent peroxiredoxin